MIKVAKACDKAVLDEEESYTEDRTTGEQMWISEENGMYVLSMWVMFVLVRFLRQGTTFVNIGETQD